MSLQGWASPELSEHMVRHEMSVRPRVELLPQLEEAAEHRFTFLCNAFASI